MCEYIWDIPLFWQVEYMVLGAAIYVIVHYSIKAIYIMGQRSVEND